MRSFLKESSRDSTECPEQTEAVGPSLAPWWRRDFFTTVGRVQQMGHRKKRTPGPQQHAEGQHGERTHRRFIEQLHESANPQSAATDKPVEGHDRLHQDRQQHDPAEKNSEQVETNREVERGNVDENVS
jgi:hypothetical protein